MPVDTAGASLATGVPARTLQRWRCTGTGPPYYRLNGRVYYSPGELAAWMAERRKAA